MARLGKYELIRKLATGGMAEVFLARFEWARGLQKTVVVKRILPHLAQQPLFREMFLSEAQLAAQLNHPGIAQIIEFGESEGTYFLSMEYVDGLSLRALEKAARARGEGIPFAHSARIAASCCEALAHAHDLVDAETGQPLHLVHRDVSPDNILIARNGAVKLVDFGIAKAATQLHHTETGHVKGKVAYMSPEQLRAEAVDRRSDVYALGVVLYEMIAGAKPYEGANDLALIAAVLTGAMVPLRARCPHVPEALERVVNRALHRRREDRYPDCRAMHADLEAALLAGRQPASVFQIAQLVARDAPALERVEPRRAHHTPDRPQPTLRTPTPRRTGGTDSRRPAEPMAQTQPLSRTQMQTQPLSQPQPQVVALAMTGTDGGAADQPPAWPPAASHGPRAVPTPSSLEEPPTAPAGETALMRSRDWTNPVVKAETRLLDRRPRRPRIAAAVLAAGALFSISATAAVVTTAVLNPGSGQPGILLEVARVIWPAPEAPPAAPAVPPREGAVTVRAVPAARVSVNGVPRGDAPLTVHLAGGRHVIRLECDRRVPRCAGQPPVTRPIVVEPGKALEVTHRWE